MSHRPPSSHSSSFYSQNSGRNRASQGDRDNARNQPPSRFSISSISSGSASIMIAPPPRSPSSHYSDSRSLPSSGSGAPPPRPPSSGYSPAVLPSSVGTRSSDGRPASPAHASFMSAYGHSSYGRSSVSDRQLPAACGPPASQLSSVHTEFESASQTSPARGPPSSMVRAARAPSSVGSRSSGGRSSGPTAASARGPAWDTAIRETYLSGVPDDDIRAMEAAARTSTENRRNRRRG